MTTLNISEYRSKLAAFHKQVLEDHEELQIPVSGRGNVAVIDAEDWQNLKETLYILRDRITIESIMRVRGERQEGKPGGRLWEDHPES